MHFLVPGEDNCMSVLQVKSHIAPFIRQLIQIKGIGAHEQTKNNTLEPRAAETDKQKYDRFKQFYA